jgi:plastocyanin domain-containing protein
MSAIFVNLLGLAAVALIVWWFWLSRPRPAAAVGDRAVDVLVDAGVYTPARIEVTAGRPVVLRFLRKDPSPCAEKVIFAGLDVSDDLPLGEPREVRLNAPPPGEHEFTCQMGMYRGVLAVKEN